MTSGGLTALVVDDELPALSELSWLLDQDPRIGEILTASSGTEALRVFDSREIDVVFSDISMPGLDGMALARVIAKFSAQPQIVFVTAHDQHAVDAFALAGAQERDGERIDALKARLDRIEGTGARPKPIQVAE